MADPPRNSQRKGTTTQPGYENPKRQVVVRNTGLAGTDHLQSIYVLRCLVCGTEYGANGSDIHLRNCPSCMGGRPGLDYKEGLMRRYWVTTHWPRREGEPEGGDTGIWLPDGRHSVGARVAPGDLLAVYESKTGRDLVQKTASGDIQRIHCRPGREGVVALAQLTGPVAENEGVEPEQYSDGSAIKWSWFAPAKVLSRSGFVERKALNRLLAFEEDYPLRGFGEQNSGLKEVSEQIWEDLGREFAASSPAVLPKKPDIPHFGGGGVGEGPVHEALKALVASDPAKVLREKGLQLLGVEYSFGTGDRADIVLVDSLNRVVGVEIEPAVEANQEAGPLQAIKYRRMLEWMTNRRPGDSRSFLVAERISATMKAKCDVYGIECFELKA